MRVVIATGNAGKLREFERILSPLGFEVVGLRQLGLKLDVEETGQTFAENARIKALAIHRQTGNAVIADDSGICVDALDGRPGVYSARYGGEELPYDEKIALMLSELEQVQESERTAQYRCVVHFILPDSSEMQFEGVCEGYVGYEQRGDNGFGYDPIFYIGSRSFAQLSDDEKDEISHRGKALRLLAKSAAEVAEKHGL